MIASAEHWFEHTLSSRWTPVLVNVAALLLVSSSAAQWTWRMVPGTGPAPAAAPAARAPGFDLQSVLAAQLFGHADPAAAGQRALPTTSLNAVLSGVIMRGADSLALVSIDGAPELALAAGQQLVPGVRLQAVLADRVVLERAGVLENLLLKEPDGKLPPGAIATAAPAGPAPVRGDGPNRFAVGREALNRQMQSPEFLSQALIVPNAGGGFLVRQIQPGSLYEKLGLRVGDVIRGVNGQPINNMDEVMRVYQQLGGAGQGGSINVEVVRAGRNEQLQYQIE